MNTTRRRILQSSAASGLAALGLAALGRSATQATSARKKRVLAILGDAYHCVAPLDSALVGRLRTRGWEAVVIMDYAVPFDDLGRFDLIIQSREGREYVKYYRDRDENPPNNGEARWITPAQEQKYEDYVNAGGRIFFYHDGFSYPALRKNLGSPPVLLGFPEGGLPGSTERIGVWIALEPMLAGA